MSVDSRCQITERVVVTAPADLASPLSLPTVPRPTLWMARGVGVTPAQWNSDTVVVHAAEISGLVDDGALVPVLGQVHVAVGAAQTRAVKAAALAAYVPSSVRGSAVLHRESAAWFHACASAPQVIEYVTHRQNRCSTRPAPPGAPVRWTVRQLLYEPQDVDRFHGCSVTTPLRTAADLACWEDARSVQALSLMLSAPHLGVDGAHVVRLLRSRSRLPHRTRGVVTVRKVCRQMNLPVPG